MDVKQAILKELELSDFFVNLYLADLTDAELLKRPCNGANHIAWQLGHLILAEQGAVARLSGAAPVELPAGFADRYKRGSAPTDNPADYTSKEEYLRLKGAVRARTLKYFENLTAADLDRQVEGFPAGVKTVGEAFVLLGMHWMMHAGQWVTIRRSTGRPALF